MAKMGWEDAKMKGYSDPVGSWLCCGMIHEGYQGKCCRCQKYKWEVK